MIWLNSSRRCTTPPDRKTIAYARVSSHDQKDDLERQKQVLAMYCAKQGWTFEVVADLGSGVMGLIDLSYLKTVSVDKQPYYGIMKQFRLGEANGLPGQPLDACA